WDAFTILQNLERKDADGNYDDEALDKKINLLLDGFEEFMDDDFNTAKVLANMFELVPIINSMKDKTIAAESFSKETFDRFKNLFKIYIEDIFGLQSPGISNDAKLDDVLQVLIDLRKTAKAKKDFVTSDRIRNELSNAGILLKDEKDGTVSYSVV
ncbi:MAG: DALR domain-containing protein, partial [Bacteroidota bacterium]